MGFSYFRVESLRVLRISPPGIYRLAQSLGKNGVYVASLRIEGYPDPLPCMVNLGSHPTAPEGPPTIEAHILDFDDDIYGRRVELTGHKFLRDERKFPSLDALKQQLKADLESTRAYFK